MASAFQYLTGPQGQGNVSNAPKTVRMTDSATLEDLTIERVIATVDRKTLTLPTNPYPGYKLEVYAKAATSVASGAGSFVGVGALDPQTLAIGDSAHFTAGENGDWYACVCSPETSGPG